MRVAGYNSLVKVTVQVFAFCFFGKYYRYVKILCSNAGNTDTAGLDSNNTSNLFLFKMAIELFANLVEQRDVDLVVNEAVHLQNVTGAHCTIL